MRSQAGRGAGAARGEYLNNAEFTRLFRFRRKNHQAICQGLKLVVAGVAARWWFSSADDRKEIESRALLFAIQRIDRFKVKASKNAFSYYSTLVLHCIGKELRRINVLRDRFVCFSQLG